MNETSLVPILFESEEFGKVRWLKLENEEYPFAVAKDITSALEYKRPDNAICKHCKAPRLLRVASPGGEQKTNCIPLSDIIRLISAASYQSKNIIVREKAERFNDLIYEKILPALITTGSYSIKPIQQTVVDPYKFTAVQQNENLKLQNENLALQNENLKLQIKMKELNVKDSVNDIHSVPNNIPSIDISTIGETQRQELNRKVKEFQRKKGNIQYFQAWQIFYNALDNYLCFQVESKRAKAAKELNKKDYSKVKWLEDHHLLPQAIIVIDGLLEQLNQPVNQ